MLSPVNAVAALSGAPGLPGALTFITRPVATGFRASAPSPAQERPLFCVRPLSLLLFPLSPFRYPLLVRRASARNVHETLRSYLAKKSYYHQQELLFERSTKTRANGVRGHFDSSP